jgi:hypothetical protein
MERGVRFHVFYAAWSLNSCSTEKAFRGGSDAQDAIMQARKPGGADAFIAYGGVVIRPTVAAAADWFVKDFQALIRAFDSSKSG